MLSIIDIDGNPRIVQYSRADTVGNVVFSPVPWGWINDALNDGAAAVDDVLSILRKRSSQGEDVA